MDSNSMSAAHYEQSKQSYIEKKKRIISAAKEGINGENGQEKNWNWSV